MSEVNADMSATQKVDADMSAKYKIGHVGGNLLHVRS
jgi:hypothetical protein